MRVYALESTSINEKKRATCLQGRLFLFGYESVTNTEKLQGFEVRVYALESILRNFK